MKAGSYWFERQAPTFRGFARQPRRQGKAPTRCHKSGGGMHSKGCGCAPTINGRRMAGTPGKLRPATAAEEIARLYGAGA